MLELNLEKSQSWQHCSQFLLLSLSFSLSYPPPTSVSYINRKLESFWVAKRSDWNFINIFVFFIFFNTNKNVINGFCLSLIILTKIYIKYLNLLSMLESIYTRTQQTWFVLTFGCFLFIRPSVVFFWLYAWNYKSKSERTARPKQRQVERVVVIHWTLSFILSAPQGRLIKSAKIYSLTTF